MEQEAATVRWDFLENQADACGVVTRHMALVFLNGPARALVGDGWFQRRCWDVFPVWEGGCAGRCPAVRSIASGCEDGASEDGIVYCEERLDVGSEDPLVLGVAVIRLPASLEFGEGGLLLLRPKSCEREEEGVFRRELIADATGILEVVRSRVREAICPLAES